MGSHHAIVLKSIRDQLGIEPYPMSVYLSVLYQDYVQWEAGLKEVPPDILERAESMAVVPHLSFRTHPEQYLARQADMRGQASLGRTYNSISRSWGVTYARVWQIVNG